MLFRSDKPIPFFASFTVNQVILLKKDPYHVFSVIMASYHGVCTSLCMLAQVCTSDLISKDIYENSQNDAPRTARGWSLDKL